MTRGKRARRADDLPAHSHSHAHAHSHGGGEPAPVGDRSRRVLVGLVVALLVATVAGLLILWPTEATPRS